MNRSLAFFLQVVVVLFGLGVLAFLLGEPHVEGRNAHATTFEIYFHDPFLAFVYVGSTPFFVALYRAFGLFGHVRRHGEFSAVTVDALRTIQRCAITLIGFVAVGIVIILLIVGDDDDRPAGFVMGLLLIGATSVVATVAAKFARRLQTTLGQSERRRV